MIINPKDLEQFFKTQRSRLGKCLEPRMSCSKDPIRAHSIQNARVIDLLEEDGHVISPRMRFPKEGPEVEFKRVGRNEASTFAGLCGDHDRSLFKPIDTKPLDLTDREQLFLLAYRSVTRELHAVMDGAIKLQMTYTSRVKRGLDSSDELSPAGMKATQQLLNSYWTYLYRVDNFDKALLSCQFDGIEHDIFELNGQKPCIAVSSLFSLDEILKESDIVRAILNVIPLDAQRTVVIFSYTKEDCTKARAFLDRILTASGEYQKYELSKLVLNRIENFLIAPAHYNSWPSVKTSTIKSAFARTIVSGGVGDIQEKPDLMLF